MISSFSHYFKLMRFDKPIGTLLLLWPTLWSLWVASDGQPSAMLFWTFVLGVFVMRSAGCVINDYADKDFDPLVERTKQRPLAAGDLAPSQALILFAVLGFIAIGLLLCLPSRVWPWAIPAAAVTIIYPFMKRFIQAPQAVLGVAFSFCIPMVYVAAAQPFDVSFVILLVMNFAWVIAYDTAYAMSDRDDDISIGVKSTAILFGRFDKIAIGILQLVVMASLFLLKQYLGLSDLFYIAIMIVAGMLIYQQSLLAAREPAKCFQAFLNNGWVGAIIWFGLLAG